MLEEADEASSTTEFIYKMKVVLRETKESRRWLRFILYCRLQNFDKLGDLPLALEQPGYLRRRIGCVLFSSSSDWLQSRSHLLI